MARAFPVDGLRRYLCGLAAVVSLLPVPGAAAPWLDADERPVAAAWQAVEILGTADADGLEPQDYGAATLRRGLEGARDGVRSAGNRAALEDSLTSSMLRYLHDLRVGRVDPREIDHHYDGPEPQAPDLRGALADSVRENWLLDLVRTQTPQVPLYAMLRAQLARYRALSGNPAWATQLPAAPRRGIREGQDWDGLSTVARRLEVLGDLGAEGASGQPPGRSAVYVLDDRLQQAIESFQWRHGLAADGVLGRQTLAQLEIAPAQRVRAIALSMERLRWTPLLRARREIVVNVPEFTLRAYEADRGAVSVKLTMSVIVGRALDTRTPLIDDDMRFIEFSPYWNIPPSIARKETVPRLRRDPAYWDREGLEFVSPSGQVFTALAGDRLDAVMRGALRIRQRPGPRNALGDIKFIFPNNDDIYLHHTPSTGLFLRERRDFSHGCIRVEDPVGLARFVLQDSPEWTEDRILEAMGRGRSMTIRLPEPIPVVIAYITVVVTHGKIRFLPDLYGSDQRLEDALERRAEARRRARIAAQSPPA